MGDIRDQTGGGPDPMKVLLAVATAPISIIAATIPGGDGAIAATQPEIDQTPETNGFLLQNAASTNQVSNPNQAVHTVKAGETLVSIAKEHGLTAAELRKVNNLTEASLLLPGQVLRLFADAVLPSVLEKASAPLLHVVKPGETLGRIAAQYSISLNSILALNNLRERSLIFPGQQLKVREVTPSVTKSVKTFSPEHTVQDGETLIDIAKKHRVSLTSLLKTNKLTKDAIIFVGQILDIPDPASATSPSTSGNEIGKPTSICLFHGFHKIKAGETVSKISAIHGVSSQALLSANNLNWNSTIFIGQKLVIPDVHQALSCPQLTPLSDEMESNAEDIIRIGRELGVGDYGIVIAMATAMQESSLRNIGFGDRDSVGLFQQRPSAHWGTKQQIMQTDYSIRAFFGGSNSPTRGVARGLLDISGWRHMPLTEAAQAVQISAHPNAYAKWEPSSWRWLIELDSLEDS